MNITQEQIGDNHVKVIMNVDPMDYLPKVDAEIKSLSKKIAVDGFRPGKVPPGITRKMYGDTVLADELNKIVSESLNNYIKEHSLKIFGEPLPVPLTLNKIDIRKPEPFQFAFEMGMTPEFEIPALDQKVFQKKILEIAPAMIEEEVERLRARHGERQYPETISENDILVGSFEELGEDGSVKEGGIVSNTSFTMKAVKDDIARQQLTNLKKEEATELNIRSAFGDDDELIIHHILHIDHHQAEGMGERFRFTLKNILSVIPAELNAEFFDKVYGAGQVTDEAQMRERIKEEMTGEFLRYTHSKLDREIQDFLLEGTQMALPVDFLRKLIDANREKDKEPLADDEFEDALRQIKWDLIFSRLASRHDINVSNEELRAEAAKDVMNYFGGNASFFSENPESLNRVIDSVLKEEKNADSLHRRVLNEKLFDVLRTTVHTEDVIQNEHEFFHH